MAGNGSAPWKGGAMDDHERRATTLEPNATSVAGPGRLEELDESQCLTLLHTQRIGRLAVFHAGQVHVFPVNFTMAGRAIGIRTALGTKLEGADFRPVAFEVDDIDQSGRVGWSVVAKGVAQRVEDALDPVSSALASEHLRPWAPGRRECLLAIHDPRLTGRRVSRVGVSNGGTDLGRRLRARREELGCSVAEVAAEAGMAPEYLEHLEHEIVVPRIEQLMALAEVLRTSLAELTGYRPD
jgi:nitroimidazol reductase NimA-like FMN-containing flavoprotein (pyridoxamine 5'-phosphate oxidase superfamily)/DNA-binding XRE family transcriptional regulator